LVLESSFEEKPYRFQGVAFAPSGSECGLPREIEGSLHFRGLSYSAWSDAYFMRAKPVAVVGSGYHAFEQALILAEGDASVTVLCENASVSPLGLLQSEVERSERITVLANARVLSLEADGNRTVAGVSIEENGRQRLLQVAGVFVAHDPVVGWETWGCQEEALALQQQGQLVLAGIAAGVRYSDHAALFESGARAARQLLATRTSRGRVSD
jgi:thioredoxin reductase